MLVGSFRCTFNVGYAAVARTCFCGVVLVFLNKSQEKELLLGLDRLFQKVVWRIGIADALSGK